MIHFNIHHYNKKTLTIVPPHLDYLTMFSPCILSFHRQTHRLAYIIQGHSIQAYFTVVIQQRVA